MKQIYIRGIVTEIVHNEDFDAVTIQTGKRKSKMKAEPGQFARSMLYQPVSITIDTDPGLFPIDEETGEVLSKSE